MTISIIIGSTQSTSSKHSASLSMHILKRVWDKEHPCLTFVLDLNFPTNP